MLHVHTPSPPLGRHVEALWYFDGSQIDGQREYVLPDGRFCVVMELDDGSPVIGGMRSRHLEIDTKAIHSQMGVLFRPGGARPFFDASAEDFFNRLVPLDAVWGQAGHAMRDRLREAPAVVGRFEVLERELTRRMRFRLDLHPAVRYGLMEFQRTPAIRGVLDVTRDAGLSRRRFAQLFREQVGMTPKLYCRLRRFRRILREVATGGEIDWADVALTGGYSDQAHLSHEFREFSGLSPSAFLAAQRPSCNHVRVG